MPRILTIKVVTNNPKLRDTVDIEDQRREDRNIVVDVAGKE